MDTQKLVHDLALRLREAQRALVLTGAGVSTESGIPDFRSAASGLWERHDPMEVASLEGFRRDPRRFYDFWGERFDALGHARPNATHRVLAALERAGIVRAVVTQNIDGLHGDAGSVRVLEVHGSVRRARCVECRMPSPREVVDERVRHGRVPICARCSGLVKPDVVLFGEDLAPAFAEAEQLARRCDVLLVLGSSLEVHPVAGLVPDAKEAGAFVAMINREPSRYDAIADLVIQAELGPTMSELARALSIAV